MTHTIVLVDDDLDDIELATMTLEETGRAVEVKAILDGKTALTLLRDGETKPDLVLLDLKMPGMNGIETLREIRADDQLKDIPVVVVTSSTLDQDRDGAYGAGADGFIHKSFNVDQFKRDVKSALERWLQNCPRYSPGT